MKYILFYLLYTISSCNPNMVKSHEEIKSMVQDLGEPTCSTHSEFLGYSMIYTKECGCGPTIGFFGTYWNITCDKEEDKQKIKHVNFIGDIKQWEILIKFLKSRQENEAKELLKLTNLILTSSNDHSKPFSYYDNIKFANDYLINLKSATFREAFTDFYNNSFKN